MSLSKNNLKLITGLSQKKYRLEHKLFVAEGVKVVNELLNSSFEVAIVFATPDFSGAISVTKIISISEQELKKISKLKTPNKVVALFKIPDVVLPKNDGFILALDTVNDPGNLGTIIRLCDWFGIRQLICSTNTVDCYNAKVVQATMGSLSRVQIHYVDLADYLATVKKDIFIADMNGANVHTTDLPNEAVLVMGNEANGVSLEVRELANYSLSIPRFGENTKTESLNVATATAILLSEFRR